jgi:AcrR family transcriptional regulator
LSSSHWAHSVDAHKQSTESAIAQAAWELAQQRGPFAVSMSDVAAAAGISRPTLYKYFRDVEAMLIAHHRNHVAAHLDELAATVSGPGDPLERLTRALSAYAEICHMRAHQGDKHVDRLVHTGFEVTAAEREVTDLFTRAITEATEAGQARADIAPEVLAAYCVRALAAAADIPQTDIAGLVDVVHSSLTAHGLDRRVT